MAERVWPPPGLKRLEVAFEPEVTFPSLSVASAASAKLNNRYMLQLSYSIHPDTRQPDEQILFPFRFISNRRRFGQPHDGFATSDIINFRRYAAVNVLVDLWDAAAACATTKDVGFAKQTIVTNFANFYRLWHLVMDDRRTVMERQHTPLALQMFVERLVWCVLQLATVEAQASIKSAHETQTKLATVRLIWETANQQKQDCGVASFASFFEMLCRRCRRLYVNTYAVILTEFSQDPRTGEALDASNPGATAGIAYDILNAHRLDPSQGVINPAVLAKVRGEYQAASFALSPSTTTAYLTDSILSKKVPLSHGTPQCAEITDISVSRCVGTLITL